MKLLRRLLHLQLAHTLPGTAQGQEGTATAAGVVVEAADDVDGDAVEDEAAAAEQGDGVTGRGGHAGAGGARRRGNARSGE